MAANLKPGERTEKNGRMSHQETLLSMDNEEEAEKNVEGDYLERLVDHHPYLHEPETKQSHLY